MSSHNTSTPLKHSSSNTYDDAMKSVNQSLRTIRQRTNKRPSNHERQTIIHPPSVPERQSTNYPTSRNNRSDSQYRRSPPLTPTSTTTHTTFISSALQTPPEPLRTQPPHTTYSSQRPSSRFVLPSYRADDGGIESGDTHGNDNLSRSMMLPRSGRLENSDRYNTMTHTSRSYQSREKVSFENSTYPFQNSKTPQPSRTARPSGEVSRFSDSQSITRQQWNTPQTSSYGLTSRSPPASSSLKTRKYEMQTRLPKKSTQMKGEDDFDASLSALASKLAQAEIESAELQEQEKTRKEILGKSLGVLQEKADTPESHRNFGTVETLEEQRKREILQEIAESEQKLRESFTEAREQARRKYVETSKQRQYDEQRRNQEKEQSTQKRADVLAKMAIKDDKQTHQKEKRVIEFRPPKKEPDFSHLQQKYSLGERRTKEESTSRRESSIRDDVEESRTREDTWFQEQDDLQAHLDSTISSPKWEDDEAPESFKQEVQTQESTDNKTESEKTTDSIDHEDKQDPQESEQKSETTDQHSLHSTNDRDTIQSEQSVDLPEQPEDIPERTEGTPEPSMETSEQSKDTNETTEEPPPEKTEENLSEHQEETKDKSKSEDEDKSSTTGGNESQDQEKNDIEEKKVEEATTEHTTEKDGNKPEGSTEAETEQLSQTDSKPEEETITKEPHIQQTDQDDDKQLPHDNPDSEEIGTKTDEEKRKEENRIKRDQETKPDSDDWSTVSSRDLDVEDKTEVDEDKNDQADAQAHPPSELETDNEQHENAKPESEQTPEQNPTQPEEENPLDQSKQEDKQVEHAASPLPPAPLPNEAAFQLASQSVAVLKVGTNYKKEKRFIRIVEIEAEPKKGEKKRKSDKEKKTKKKDAEQDRLPSSLFLIWENKPHPTSGPTKMKLGALPKKHFCLSDVSSVVLGQTTEIFKTMNAKEKKGKGWEELKKAEEKQSVSICFGSRTVDLIFTAEGVVAWANAVATLCGVQVDGQGDLHSSLDQSQPEESHLPHEEIETTPVPHEEQPSETISQEDQS